MTSFSIISEQFHKRHICHIPQPLNNTNISLKIVNLKFHSNLPRANELTHSHCGGLNKMSDILQTTHWNAFFWNKIYVYWLKLVSIGSDNGLALKRCQAFCHYLNPCWLGSVTLYAFVITWPQWVKNLDVNPWMRSKHWLTDLGMSRNQPVHAVPRAQLGGPGCNM